MTTTLSQYRAALKDYPPVDSVGVVVYEWLTRAIARLEQLDSANEGQNSPINQCLQG